MKKVIFTILAALSLTLGLASVASAKDQIPMGEVFLGSYEVAIGSTYSDYCTATLSHINLVVHESSGATQFIPQYRKPNGVWTSMTSTWQSVGNEGWATYNINAVKGNDYRLQLRSGNSPLTTKGSVTCW